GDTSSSRRSVVVLHSMFEQWATQSLSSDVNAMTPSPSLPIARAFAYQPSVVIGYPCADVQLTSLQCATRIPPVQEYAIRPLPSTPIASDDRQPFGWAFSISSRDVVAVLHSALEQWADLR